jgi:alpha-galactosidase
VLSRIFTPRPHILLESCSSGGNRFDLGMLCF